MTAPAETLAFFLLRQFRSVQSTAGVFIRNAQRLLERDLTKTDRNGAPTLCPFNCLRG